MRFNIGTKIGNFYIGTSFGGNRKKSNNKDGCLHKIVYFTCVWPILLMCYLIYYLCIFPFIWCGKKIVLLIRNKKRKGGSQAGRLENSRILGASDMDNMSGIEFESYCAELLRANGFSEINLTARSGDQGVDILAEKDGVKYAVQCKKYSSPLGNTPVQEVTAGRAIYGCHIGVVMTNSTFTQGARDAADATGTLLWGREKVLDMAQKIGW